MYFYKLFSISKGTFKLFVKLLLPGNTSQCDSFLTTLTQHNYGQQLLCHRVYVVVVICCQLRVQMSHVEMVGSARFLTTHLPVHVRMAMSW